MFRCRLEMTISREDFLRLLSSAVSAFDVEGDTIRWTERGQSWVVRLLALPPRAVGRVGLPRHAVEVSSVDAAEAEGEAFMTRFHRAFLRGGG